MGHWCLKSQVDQNSIWKCLTLRVEVKRSQRYFGSQELREMAKVTQLEKKNSESINVIFEINFFGKRELCRK